VQRGGAQIRAPVFSEGLPGTVQKMHTFIKAFHRDVSRVKHLFFIKKKKQKESYGPWAWAVIIMALVLPLSTKLI
jgi:hypothetical protein